VPGELYIGGVGLARGYLNQPDLTAERFLPSPFGQEEVLFKTGDLGRYLPDGNIEYLGRRDHQVKVRGFRIELAEIETVLAQHASVREAVVLAIEDKPLDKLLVAYITADRDKVDKISELRNFLKQRLPDYMVPQAYVFLDALPLTPSGKVDRPALSKHDFRRSTRENELVAPKTATEKFIVGIWRKLLGVNEIGIYDNFFELGGHSLLATRVISHVRDTFQVELPMHCFFDVPTVAGLTEALEKYEAVPGRGSAIARILKKIDAMDAEEIRAMLRDKRKTGGS
jgi:acyl carrier protein